MARQARRTRRGVVRRSSVLTCGPRGSVRALRLAPPQGPTATTPGRGAPTTGPGATAPSGMLTPIEYEKLQAGTARVTRSSHSRFHEAGANRVDEAARRQVIPWSSRASEEGME